MRKFALFIALAFSSLANAAPAGQEDLQIIDENNQVVPMPINGMVAAIKNGKVAFVSDNGRYVIQGSVYDTWNQEEITTLAQAREAGKYIKLDKLKFDTSALSPFTVGHGPKVVTLFVDPQCPNCHLLLKDIQALKDQYTFQIVAVPVLGDESARIVRAAHCTSDPKAAESVIVDLQIDIALPQDSKVQCNTDALAKRLITAQLFGVKGVPFLIRDDGLVKTGYQKGELKSWLTSPQG